MADDEVIAHDGHEFHVVRVSAASWAELFNAVVAEGHMGVCVFKDAQYYLRVSSPSPEEATAILIGVQSPGEIHMSENVAYAVSPGELVGFDIKDVHGKDDLSGDDLIERIAADGAEYVRANWESLAQAAAGPDGMMTVHKRLKDLMRIRVREAYDKGRAMERTSPSYQEAAKARRENERHRKADINDIVEQYARLIFSELEDFVSSAIRRNFGSAESHREQVMRLVGVAVNEGAAHGRANA